MLHMQIKPKIFLRGVCYSYRRLMVRWFERGARGVVILLHSKDLSH